MLQSSQDVDFKELPKVHGTRFLGHKRIGISNFLTNWPIFQVTCENAVAQVGARSYKAQTKAKISGFLNKFRDYRLLLLTAMYLDLLEKVSPLSKVFEAENILPCEVNVSVQTTVLELQDLADVAGTDEELLDSHFTKFNNIESNDGGEKFLRVERIRRGDMRKKPVNRGTVELVITNLSHATENIVANVRQQKKYVALKWIEVIQERFSDFRENVFREMEWLDRSSWTDAIDYGDNQILTVSTDFDSPLTFAGFDIDAVLKEWKSCKRYVNVKFSDLETKNYVIWRHILTRKKGDFPNLSILVSLLLTISVSNSTVERGFSILTMMMTDRRLNLSHEVLVDIMRIKINDKVWSVDERERIISRAVKLYTDKRRSLLIDNPTNKRKADDDDDDDDGNIEEGVSNDDDSDIDIDFFNELIL